MSADEVAVDHHLDDSDEYIHYDWENDREPVLTVESGEVIEFGCRDATDGQLGPGSEARDVVEREGAPGHPLTGPVEVAGAEPGDALVVELLDLEHHGWGVSYYYPAEEGYGLLPEEFDEPGIHVWDLDGDVGHFTDDIEVPLAPFPGVMGVAPAEDGTHDTMPPRRVGGNMDVKHLTAGSTLILPVEVAGALFSIGDCHAAQGDGEVCVTGIEAPMTVTARLSLRKGGAPAQPEFRTQGPFTATGQDEEMYGTMGISDDLMDATKEAIRRMLDRMEERGLSRGDAYMLASAAVDLKINEVVDAPNWVVSAYLPESIFPESES